MANGEISTIKLNWQRLAHSFVTNSQFVELVDSVGNPNRQIKSNQLHFTIHPVLIGRAVRYTETYQLHFYCQSVKLRWSRPSMKHSNMWSIRWNCSESHNMDIVDEWKIFTDSIENIQHTVLHIPVKIFFSTNSHQFYFKGNCQPKKTYNKSLFSDVFDHFIKQ